MMQIAKDSCQCQKLVNTFRTRWISCGDIHCYQLVLVRNSNAVCFCRRYILLGIFHLLVKMVNMANIVTLMLTNFRSFPKYFRLYATAASLGLPE